MAGHKKGNGKKTKIPEHCSGSMIGNDKTFVTSAECGEAVNTSWENDRLGTYCTIGGEQILTRDCKVDSKESIAVCQLVAAVNPETVLIPCYPSVEVKADEILATESQTSLNSGTIEEGAAAVQKTWLPTHRHGYAEDSDDNAVIAGSFWVGFSGAGHNLCNSESGTPIFRDTEEGTRELIGIITSESAKCKENLAFSSLIRHSSFIADLAAEFYLPETGEAFEGYAQPEQECEDVDHVFDESCTPFEISSPGYPNLYNNDLKCKWNFSAPRNHLIKVVLNEVDIEPTSHPRKCLNDGLFFSEPGRMPSQICNHRYTGKEMVSIRNQVELNFESDDSVTARGFSATVSCVLGNKKM